MQKAKVLDRNYAPYWEGNRKKVFERVPLVLDFHATLLGIGRKMHEGLVILHASSDMKRIFKEPPMVNFRRPKNLKDELVRSKVGKWGDTW